MNTQITSLSSLATRANKEHELATQAAATAIGHALASGEALTAAKALVPHGAWGEWLESNFAASDRTARQYMLLHERRDRLPNWQRAADLSLREAVSLITDAKPPRQALPPPPVARDERAAWGCRLWWDFSCREVLPRWARKQPLDEIAIITGLSIVEVRRIMRPEFITWEFPRDGEKIKEVELYTAATRQFVGSKQEKQILYAIGMMERNGASEAEVARLEVLLEQARDMQKTPYGENVWWQLYRIASEQNNETDRLYWASLADLVLLEVRRAIGIDTPIVCNGMKIGESGKMQDGRGFPWIRFWDASVNVIGRTLAWQEMEVAS